MDDLLVSDHVYEMNPEYRDMMTTTRQAKPVRVRRSSSSESDEQITLFAMLSLYSSQYPELDEAFHVPNGEARDHKVNDKGKRYSPAGNKLKRMGAKSGVWDIMMLVRRGRYSGFIGEMKVGSNDLDPEQVSWRTRWEREGYYCTVQWSAEDMLAEMIGYLKLDDSIR